VIGRTLALLATAALIAAACGAGTPAPAPASPTAAPAVTGTPQPAAKARIFVLSNSSPHVTVIDGETSTVLRTADVPDLGAWGWSDDNNFSDGKELWLGVRDPRTNEAAVITLDVSSLEVTARIPIGKEATTTYIGKPTRDGLVFVAKHASWQMAVIDIKTKKLQKAVDVDVNAGTTGQPPRWAACDSDATLGPDGIERVYMPTNAGTTTVALDVTSVKPLKVFSHPAGSRPCMLTVSPDKKVWVQECDGNANAILDPVTLDVVKRVGTGKGPVVATFSPDGALAYTGHSGDTVVLVHDTKTFAEVARVQVGTNPDKVGVHPNGKHIYATVSKEAALAVIDTATWTVTKRVPLGTNPTGLFVLPVR
jgi:YVTN family beta-propeller protein